MATMEKQNESRTVLNESVWSENPVWERTGSCVWLPPAGKEEAAVSLKLKEEFETGEAQNGRAGESAECAFPPDGCSGRRMGEAVKGGGAALYHP